MCVITILHCTQCKLRQDMAEEGLIITKDWHAQLLVSLDPETIPFKRCIEALNHGLSSSRSNTTEYPRCRMIEVKHMCVKKSICFRCSTRRKIQNLITIRKVYEEQSATWRRDERRDPEAVNDMRRSIRESLRSITTTRRERVCCATADLLTTKIAPVTPMMTSWEACLEMQIFQRELTKAKDAEKRAKLAEEKEKEDQRKQARLSSVQQGLARINRLRTSPAMEGDTEQSSSSRREQPLRLQIVRTVRMVTSGVDHGFDEMVPSQVPESVSGPSSLQDTPASPEVPPPAMTTTVFSGLPRSNKAIARFHTVGPASAIKVHLSGEDSSIGAAMRPVAGSATLPGTSTLRAEAPEFASLRGFPAMRAEAPEFKPLQQAPPTEPRMMRVPTAPRAVREGSLRQAAGQPRQKYFTNRGYPTFGRW